MPDVFITGYGSISPLGTTKREFTDNLKSGRICLSEVPPDAFPSECPVRYLGLIPNQKLGDFSIAQRNSWIRELLEQLPKQSAAFDTLFLVHNSGIDYPVYFHMLKRESFSLDAPDYGLMRPQDLISAFTREGLVDGGTKIIYLNNTCASVAAAVTYAAHRIQAGLGARALVLAFEHSNEIWPALFALNALGVINTKAETSHCASIPFSKMRSGIVKADALGFLVLESKPAGQAIAEFMSGSITCDSSSLTDGVADGSSVEKSMGLCVEEAGIGVHSVSYINAHGSGTYLNDLIEANGIKRLFKERAKDVLVSSTKSQFGHALCATGVVEISAVLAMFEEQFVAANAGAAQPDLECGLNLVTRPAIDVRLDYVVKNSFGFGGYNSSILLKNLQ